jgi:hypothetical protein
MIGLENKFTSVFVLKVEKTVRIRFKKKKYSLNLCHQLNSPSLTLLSESQVYRRPQRARARHASNWKVESLSAAAKVLPGCDV